MAEGRLRLWLVRLNGNFLGFLEFWVKKVHGLMVLFPCGLEIKKFFGIAFVSK